MTEERQHGVMLGIVFVLKWLKRCAFYFNHFLGLILCKNALKHFMGEEKMLHGRWGGTNIPFDFCLHYQ